MVRVIIESNLTQEELDVLVDEIKNLHRDIFRKPVALHQNDSLQDQLHAEVHEDIMKARIKIWKMRNEEVISIAEIDDILCDLAISAPQKAIDVISPKLTP